MSVEEGSKIKDLTAKTTVVATDELGINDVAGGDADKKEGLDDIKTFMSLSPTLVTPASLGVQQQALNMNGNDADNIQNLIHDISTSGTDIDFAEDELQTISISANTTFTTANRAAGKSKTLKIITDGTLRTFTFPGWDWVSDIPADQAASKNGYLTLTSYSTTDAAIVAAYQVGSL